MLLVFWNYEIPFPLNNYFSILLFFITTAEGNSGGLHEHFVIINTIVLTRDSKSSSIKLGVCMGRVGSGCGDFLTQPTMVGQKKPNPTQPITLVQPNPTQPTWVGLGRVEPMGLKFFFYY